MFILLSQRLDQRVYFTNSSNWLLEYEWWHWSLLLLIFIPNSLLYLWKEYGAIYLLLPCLNLHAFHFAVLLHTFFFFFILPCFCMHFLFGSTPLFLWIWRLRIYEKCWETIWWMQSPDWITCIYFVLQLSTEDDISTQWDSKFDKAQNNTRRLFVAVLAIQALFGSGR